MDNVDQGIPSLPDPPAPAGDFTPIASPAAQEAVEARDFRAFKRAETTDAADRRDGKATPLTTNADSSPAHPAADTTASAPVTPPAKSKAKQRSAQLEQEIKDLNDKLRLRAQLREELDRREPVHATPPASQPAQATSDEFPDYPDYLQTHPNASLRDWQRAHFQHLRGAEERDRAVREVTEAHARSVDQVVESFHQQFTDTLKADPGFLDRLSPEVADARPVQALGKGERATPVNVIASEVMKSSMAPKLMEHLSAHPDQYTRLQQLPDHLKGLPLAIAAPEHVRWIAREVGKIEAALDRGPVPTRTVTGAPAPGSTLGSRPAAPADAAKSAVERQDFRTAKSAWTAQAASRLLR